MTLATPATSPAKPISSRKMISIPFVMLRGVSTAGVVMAAMIQIYVFARITTPEKFSIFILVGTLGYSLWLADFGVVRYLFVRLRAPFLAGRQDAELVRQSTLIVLLYFGLILVGMLLCFSVLSLIPAVGPVDAAYYALFFTFTALNLVWYALRYISIAIDDYIYFECVEASRRYASILLMLTMLVGAPLLGFLIAVNLLWALVLTIAIARLKRRGALTFDLPTPVATLIGFYSQNRREIVESGASATSGNYIEFLPYLVVPLAFGLGSPTVILDAIFKFFRGANLFFYAVCEIVLPRQTSAFAERDGRTLLRTTLLAYVLCLGPALVVSGLLLVIAEPFFRILLGPAATMPPEAIWVIIGLLLGDVLVTVSKSLLVHTGFFRITARLMVLLAVGLTAVGGASLLGSPSIVGFMASYAAVYSCGGVLLVVLAFRGPIRTAHEK